MREKIIESFRPKVSIRDLHVRYEQAVSEQRADRPFALGLLISSFAIMIDAYEQAGSSDGGCGTRQSTRERAGRSGSRRSTVRHGPANWVGGKEDKATTSRVKLEMEKMGVYCMPLQRKEDAPMACQASTAEHQMVFGPRHGPFVHEPAGGPFFEQQEALIARMDGVCESSTQWEGYEWMLKPFDFVIRSWRPNLVDFQTEATPPPLVSIICALPPFELDVSDSQLAAFTSLQALKKRYTLRTLYVMLRESIADELMPNTTGVDQCWNSLRPAAGAAARVFWRAAVGAVARALKGGRTNAAQAIHSLRLRREYLELAAEMFLCVPPEKAEEVDEFQEARVCQPRHPNTVFEYPEPAARTRPLWTCAP